MHENPRKSLHKPASPQEARVSRSPKPAAAAPVEKSLLQRGLTLAEKESATNKRIKDALKDIEKNIVKKHKTTIDSNLSEARPLYEAMHAFLIKKELTDGLSYSLPDQYIIDGKMYIDLDLGQGETPVPDPLTAPGEENPSERLANTRGFRKISSPGVVNESSTENPRQWIIFPKGMAGKVAMPFSEDEHILAQSLQPIKLSDSPDASTKNYLASDMSNIIPGRYVTTTRDVFLNQIASCKSFDEREERAKAEKDRDDGGAASTPNNPGSQLLMAIAVDSVANDPKSGEVLDSFVCAVFTHQQSLRSDLANLKNSAMSVEAPIRESISRSPEKSTKDSKNKFKSKNFQRKIRKILASHSFQNDGIGKFIQNFKTRSTDCAQSKNIRATRFLDRLLFHRKDPPSYHDKRETLLGGPKSRLRCAAGDKFKTCELIETCLRSGELTIDDVRRVTNDDMFGTSKKNQTLNLFYDAPNGVKTSKRIQLSSNFRSIAQNKRDIIDVVLPHDPDPSIFAGHIRESLGLQPLPRRFPLWQVTNAQDLTPPSEKHSKGKAAEEYSQGQKSKIFGVKNVFSPWPIFHKTGEAEDPVFPNSVTMTEKERGTFRALLARAPALKEPQSLVRKRYSVTSAVDPTGAAASRTDFPEVLRKANSWPQTGPKDSMQRRTESRSEKGSARSR